MPYKVTKRYLEYSFSKLSNDNLLSILVLLENSVIEAKSDSEYKREMFGDYDGQYGEFIDFIITLKNYLFDINSFAHHLGVKSHE